MIYEFVGLPGSGKTTLARSLLRATGADPCPAAGLRDARSSPVRSVRVAREIARTVPTSSSRLHLKAAVEVVQQRPNIAIADQGALQRLISMAWNEQLEVQRTVELLHCIASETRDRRFVVVEVAPEVAASRVSARKNRLGVVAGLRGSELRSALGWSAEVLARVVRTDPGAFVAVPGDAHATIDGQLVAEVTQRIRASR